MIRAVVFDVDGVLLRGYHAQPEKRESWDKSLADLGINADRFQREFIFDVFMKKVLVGQMPMIEALDRRLPGFGYRGSSMAFARHWLEHDAHLDHDLLEVIRRLTLHPEIRLFLATNQDHMRAQWIWQTLRLGDLFDDMFYSARFGVTKAHKKFFSLADSRMPQADLPPLFFDDTAKVIDTARSAGWDAVHYASIADVIGHPWLSEHLH